MVEKVLGGFLRPLINGRSLKRPLISGEKRVLPANRLAGAWLRLTD